MIDIIFTDNHYQTAEEAVVEANKILAANNLSLVTYGPRGGGKRGSISERMRGGGGAASGGNLPEGADSPEWPLPWRKL